MGCKRGPAAHVMLCCPYLLCAPGRHARRALQQLQLLACDTLRLQAAALVYLHQLADACHCPGPTSRNITCGRHRNVGPCAEMYLHGNRMGQSQRIASIGRSVGAARSNAHMTLPFQSCWLAAVVCL